MNVTNNVESNSDTSQQTKTKIRIETNGQVQEYESDKNEDISLESKDGNTKVKVSNKSGNSDYKDNNDESTNSAEKKRVEPTTQPPELDVHENFFEKIIDSIKKFFFQD